MQILEDASVSPRARQPRITSLAGELSGHWEELSRFFLDRKVHSSQAGGPGGDLTHVQLGALAALSDGDERMGDLAARLGVAESSMTRMVDRLVLAGLAHREPAPHDRRCVVAGLTPEGRKVLQRVRTERREFMGELLEALSPADRTELVRLFGVLADALRARRDASAARPSTRKEARA